MKDYDQPARIELDAIKLSDQPEKMEIVFQSFDASKTEENVPLPVSDQLSYIDSLNIPNITIKNGVIHWDGK